MDPQMLIQFVFVPEGFATVGAFKRTETLPDEKMLQGCILRWRREEQAVKHPISVFQLTVDLQGQEEADEGRGHVLKCCTNINIMEMTKKGSLNHPPAQTYLHIHL